ncbi:MAG: 30S ribosomal protein S8 [Candidatus Diapherotrites archaeon]|nr:30S ribosomal protein S8 [Candidatus Diapherotrites archaeon]
MALNDTLANAMICIKNGEAIGHDTCVIRPASKLIKEVLRVMQKNEYIGDFEEVDDGRDKLFKVKLSGKVNNCKAIKPRLPIKRTEYDVIEKQYLPAKGVGIIIITTPDGVMSLDEAKEKKIGGRLLAFVY